MVKFIDERFPPYFILGEGLGTRFVDVCTVNGTVATVSYVDALRLIKDRGEARKMMRDMAELLASVDYVGFDEIWHERLVLANDSHVNDRSK